MDSNVYGYILFSPEALEADVTQEIEKFVKNCKQTFNIKNDVEVFYDLHPGNTFDRPNWNSLKGKLKKKDHLLVKNLQSFSRTTLRTTLNEIDNLKKRDIQFTMLSLNEDPNEFWSYVLKIYEYFEDIRLERQGTAIASIAANIILRQEKYPGRKTVLDKQFLDQLQDLLAQNVTSPTELARRLEKSRSTIYKALKLLKEQEKFSSNLNQTIADGET